MLLIGDQVYADAVPAAMREIIASRRDPEEPPGWEVADFEEYTWLYRLSWTEPAVRWLLSTVPSMMILDVKDDWNISRDWRERMHTEPWWPERLSGGLGAYWIYQHLGNLSPAQRAADPLFAALCRDGAGDAAGFFDRLARAADRDGDARWAYSRDFGSTRLVVLDSRGGRVLEPGRLAMIGPRQQAWFDELLHDSTSSIDHLLIATSVPYLLTYGLHHLEAWDEAVADGAWGRRASALAEWLRQEFDLEHWASFHRSFTAVARTVASLAAGHPARRPASIVFLSGDVHYSYLARVRSPAGTTPISQVVSSPIRNPLPSRLRAAVRAASLGISGAVSGIVAAATGVTPRPLSWRITHGPWFTNTFATVELDGRDATVRWENPASRPISRLRQNPLDAVLGNHVAVPVEAVLRSTGPGRVVDEDEPEPLRVAFRPLEIVQQGPREISP